MPVGLPHVSSTPQQCRIYAAQIAETWNDFLLFLDLPSTTLYWNSCQTAFQDVKVATTSLYRLGYLTLKPLVLIVWLILQYIWRLLQFIGNHLFRQFYISAKKGMIQMKWASREFAKWQSSLSNAEIMMELAVVAALVGAFLLRRHISQRKYVARAKSWYRRKKRAVKENYRRGVRRVADTSLFLAMLMPHAIFLGSVASLKLFFPRILGYLATDTYLLSILSFWYPLISTIGLVQNYRNGSTPVEHTTTPEGATTRRRKSSSKYTTPPKRSSAGFFPRMTPSRSVQKWLKAATTPVRRAVSTEETYDINDDATYWLEYWVVDALLLATCRLTVLLPIVGRFQYALFSSILRELQLVFFLWIFCVPLVTPELTKESRPLPLLYQRVVPVVTAIYNSVSNAIPESLWQNVVLKASSFLDLAVMIKLISSDTKDWLVHVLEESRPVLPPALTLFMPGFLTEYGVLYVKTLVPCAKCSNSKTLEERMAWLEYWVLHGLVSVVVTWWSPILWWIPFSTHAVFLLWCNLQIPKTRRKWYNVLEEELQAFGLLEMSSDKDLAVEQTMTARVLRKLASSLPSASNVNADNNNSVQGEQPTQGEEKSNTSLQKDNDGDAVMVEQEEDGNGKTSTADSEDSSWSSDENNRGNNNNNSNVMTRRRSTRQRKQASAY